MWRIDARVGCAGSSARTALGARLFEDSATMERVMAGKFIVYKGKDGRAYSVLTATDGQQIAHSQICRSSVGCRNGKKSAARHSADATLVEE